MKTFTIKATIEGKLTVPESLVQSLRHEAVTSAHESPQPQLSRIHLEHPTDDDAFVQAALKNALRQIVRHGIIADIGGLGVGVRIAPPQVSVSVPERVITAIKSKEQIGVDRISVQQINDAQLDAQGKGQEVTGLSDLAHYQMQQADAARELEEALAKSLA
jgi:hypothetical protein